MPLARVATRYANCPANGQEEGTFVLRLASSLSEEAMLRDQLIIGTAFFVPVTLLFRVARSVVAERRANAAATGLARASEERRRVGDAVSASQQAA